MKRKRLWKPGGRPRRGMGSMRVSRRKSQRLTRRNAVLRKEVVILGAGS